MVQSPQRILLIEDNPDHALVATRILQRAGYEVSSAATGREGIDAAQSGGFDLVLLDYGLPDMDGMSVLSEIAHIGTPVVFVTGRSDAKLAVDALRAGATNYIVKDAHYVSNLPDVARQTLDRQTDRLRAVNGVRVRNGSPDEELLRRFFGRFVPQDAFIVRYAPNDYLVFAQGKETQTALEHLQANAATFRGVDGEDLNVTVTAFSLERDGSLSDVLA